MHRPRVLYVVLERDWSGAETAYVPILRADPDPLLACPPGSATEAWARRLGIETVALEHRAVRTSAGGTEALRGAGRALLAARDLRRVLAAHPDRRVVVATSVRPGIVASLAALGLHGRVVVWTITDLVRPAPVAAAVRALARATRARAITHSRYVAERMAPRALVSPPGVSPAEDAAPSREPEVALLVGHVSPTKHTELALEIALRVSEHVPGFRVDVLGRAQYRDEDHALERRLRERLRTDPVAARHMRLLGHDQDVAGRMRDAGLLLHCRPDEPFGMVLIEAMAAGLPVVAPAAAGPLEIVLDGETGLLYPPGDADAAARCVLRLVRDPALSRRLGAAGRERVRRCFSAERQVADFDAFLHKIAPGHPASSS